MFPKFEYLVTQQLISVCFWLMFSLSENLKKCYLSWSATSNDLCCSHACMSSDSLIGFMDISWTFIEILTVQERNLKLCKVLELMFRNGLNIPTL